MVEHTISFAFLFFWGSHCRGGVPGVVEGERRGLGRGGHGGLGLWMGIYGAFSFYDQGVGSAGMWANIEPEGWT